MRLLLTNVPSIIYAKSVVPSPCYQKPSHLLSLLCTRSSPPSINWNIAFWLQIKKKSKNDDAGKVNQSSSWILNFSFFTSAVFRLAAALNKWRKREKTNGVIVQQLNVNSLCSFFPQSRVLFAHSDDKCFGVSKLLSDVSAFRQQKKFDARAHIRFVFSLPFDQRIFPLFLSC